MGNHPLPDGDKRTAFLLTVAFLERNGRPQRGPDVGRDVELVRRVAAGETDLDEIVGWIDARFRAP